MLISEKTVEFSAQIGVYGGNLWFHIDGEKGACYWGYNEKADFEREGFALMEKA